MFFLYDYGQACLITILNLHGRG